jgi:dTDP-4-dehydrorhamnose reductase
LLATACDKLCVKYIHITTDCVFSGNGGMYSERDAHDETNNYGVSKSLGELGINATVIRTSIIGEEMKNKYSLLEWVRSHTNTEINGYTNHYWNGVTCLQLSKIVANMILYKQYWIGVRHIFSPSPVSKYDLVCMINEIYGLNNTVNKFATEQKVDKTLSSIHNECKSFEIPDLKTQITQLQQYRDLNT